MWWWGFCVGCVGSGDRKRGSFGEVGPAPSWGTLAGSTSGGKGFGRSCADSLSLLVSLQHWPPNRPTSLTPIMQSSRAAGAKQAEEPQPPRMVHRARAIPEGPADVCLPRGHPRMWLGAEDSRSPGHHCWASHGGQPEEAEWLGQLQVVPHRPSFWTMLCPAPKHRGSGLESPALAFSPSSCLRLSCW